MKMVCLASIKANIKENSFFLGCKIILSVNGLLVWIHKILNIPNAMD